MIRTIRLQNFRGFADHTLPLRPMTVVVGRNNAGKTTIVEALRLLSMVTLRYQHLPFRDPPDDTDLPRRMAGVSPSLKNAEVSFNTIFHQYRDPPAIITATFTGGAKVEIYLLSEQRLHAVIMKADGDVVRSGRGASDLGLPEVRIMPQVAPLLTNETILAEDYVRGAMSSRLAPLHFRNQLRLRPDLFMAFKQAVEETWPTVQVRTLIGGHRLEDTQLHLEVRNEGFVAEVGDMGHGLQMWLQTMWFLTVAKEAPIVILDEPDVYMHADLQRRIIRWLRNRHEQTIITTHSVEIMSEVEPEDILVVDKKRRKSRFAGSVPAVQAVVERFGSVHNVHLTRLLSAQKVILVEGKDLKFLKAFQDTLFPGSSSPFEAVPNMSVGGWSGWKLAVGTAKGFHSALGESIRTYCVLDSDYHTPEEMEERYVEAKQNSIELHIWTRKEIENYLLDVDVLHRLIAGRAANGKRAPSAEAIEAKLRACSEGMADEVLDAMAADILARQRGLGQGGANKVARRRIREIQEREGNIVSLASGKRLLSAILNWAKARCGASFSPAHVAREMRSEEVPREVICVVEAVETGERFGGEARMPS